MAVTVSLRTAGSKTGANATTLTASHTHAGGITNGVLVVYVTTGAGVGVDISSVVWDAAGANESLTFFDKHFDGNCFTEIWHKLSPTAGASKLITVTAASSCEITISAASYKYVNQTTPWRGGTAFKATNSPSGGTPQPSVAVTTVANDMAAGVAFSNENSSDDIFTAGTGCTLIGSQNIGAAKHSGGAVDIPAVGVSTAVSMNGVGDGNNWAIVAGSLMWDGSGSDASSLVSDLDEVRGPWTPYDEDQTVVAYR